MDGEHGPRAAWARAAGHIAVSLVVIGIAAVAWNGPGEVRGTYAEVFPNPVVDLQLSGPRGVNGFLTTSNIAPGDRFSGRLVVSDANPTPEDVLDLDVDFQLDEPTHRARSLLVTNLRYGVDDLLSGADGGRDLLVEIDANPLLGDGDGRLTLYELQAGFNDLPRPAARDRGGTAFDVGFELDTAFTEQSVRLSRFQVVFFLADNLNADLN